MAAARAWFRRHALAVDCIIAVAFFALGMLSVRINYDVAATRPHNFRFATSVALTALLTLPIALRRRVPPIPLICVTLAIVGYTVWGVTEEVQATAAFVAIYSVGAYCAPRVANWVRGLCIAVMFSDLMWILLFRQMDLNHSKASVLGAGLLSVGSSLFFFIAAWVIGDVARISRMRAAALAERNAELQTAQAMVAEQAVLDERVHIAREVHDVVAHHVSVMGVQAGAARRVMARSPDQAAEVLSGIEASSRQAVDELHRLLGFLRSETDDASDDTAPQPTLSRLDALISQVNEAGLRATADIEGTPRPLPASLDLSAYRVAQEAMTNALKHGGAGTVVGVTVRYTPDSLELSVVDNGRGRSNARTDQPPLEPVPAAGHGLVGMRERVALHGGRFDAGPQRGSGFAVHATFPLPAAFRTAS
jgi:signal transduction histidine kinase